MTTAFKVTKNNLKDSHLILLVESENKSREKKISILDVAKNSAWHCQLTDNIAQTYYKRFELSAEEYWKDVEKPLQQPLDTYQYWIIGQEFSLKKMSQDVNVSLEFFRIPLSGISIDELQTRIISELLNTNSESQKKISTLNEETEKIRKERDAFKSELEKGLREKIEFEEMVFPKFVQILNAKKEKILELQNNQSKHKDASKHQKLSERDSSSSDDAYDRDTDVEEQSDIEMKEQPTTAETTINLKDVLSL
ncbi:hypothetical protein B566_EDAN001069 [Ephemera danica]|nr:hypothetical protein B566_EDAN001069 [Ephemera danica]